MKQLKYDQNGKLELIDTYNRYDPSSYYSTLFELDYKIPQEAKPQFQKMIDARRVSRESKEARIVDLGCSYGVNGALLKFDLSLDRLYDRYRNSDIDDSEALLARDRALYAAPSDPGLDMVGIDAAERAVGYAVDAGMLDAGIATNLEESEPTAQDVALLENTDLVISTGCVGYVTETSLERILEPSLNSQPWMAHFVLRMFDFGAVEEMLGRYGYTTEKVPGLFPQRRFASGEERAHVMDNLDRLGIDPEGAEDTGWYFAELHVSRPEADCRAMPLGDILSAAA